jgi:hypothetical protein
MEGRAGYDEGGVGRGGDGRSRNRDEGGEGEGVIGDEGGMQ